VEDNQADRHRGDSDRDRNRAPSPAAGIAVLALTEDVAHSRTARGQLDVLDITIALPPRPTSRQSAGGNQVDDIAMKRGHALSKAGPGVAGATAAGLRASAVRRVLVQGILPAQLARRLVGPDPPAPGEPGQCLDPGVGYLGGFLASTGLDLTPFCNAHY
jgi:hypothetical protein